MFVLNTVTKSEFDSLKETMQMYQNNIDNNITWFYTVLGIIVGVLLVGLYFLIKNSVSAGVEKGIKDVSGIVQKELNTIRDELQELKESQEQKVNILISDIDEFKSSLDHHVIQLIKNNSKIRWAKGRVNQTNNDFVYAGGLNGNIDWGSPITNVRVYDPINKKEIKFELIQKMDNAFTFKITSGESFEIIEWIIVWYEKD